MDGSKVGVGGRWKGWTWRGGGGGVGAYRRTGSWSFMDVPFVRLEIVCFVLVTNDLPTSVAVSAIVINEIQSP